jgi:putative (di)nucleoside polyphosphate hydrolase
MTADPSDSLYRPCVGAMLLNPLGRVLVGHRLDSTSDAWQMPQGGVEKGENPADAVLRELEEEIGTAKARIIAESAGWRRYDLPARLQGKVWGGRYRGQRMKWFLLAFTGRDADIRPDAVANPEFKAWKWVEPADLPKLIVAFKRPLYEEVLAEFAASIAAFRG